MLTILKFCVNESFYQLKYHLRIDFLFIELRPRPPDGRFPCRLSRALSARISDFIRLSTTLNLPLTPAGLATFLPAPCLTGTYVICSENTV